jgi:ABC-2 type transport system ATP-binding protein
MENALHVENLAKSYKRRLRQPGLLAAFKSMFSAQTEEFQAVKGITFSIKRGEKVGLIGENGAGKSTTLKMLTGIIVPTSGRLNVLGLVPWQKRQQLALNIGVVFGQRPQLLWDIPVRETFTLLKAMYRIPDEVFQITYPEAVKRLDLQPLLNTPVRLLSLGQRMRCDLAASLLHAPAVAFLDEPTIGLDLTVKEQVREYIRDMQNRFGTTLLVTTHDLKDITEVCDRLLLLDKGKLLFDGSLKAFEKKFASDSRIVAELHQPATPSSLRKLSAEIKRYGCKIIVSEDRRLVLEYRKAGATPVLTQILLKRQKVVDLTLEKTDIETIVTRIYRKPTGEKMKP